MAKKRTSAATTGGKEAASTVQYDAILDAAAKLKAAVEEKSARALQAVLGDSPIWVANKPGNVTTLANSIAALTGKATDLELSITKIIDTELTDDEANISLECQLVWSNADTWEEREASFDLHLGLAWDGNTWTFAHLAVLPAKVAAPGGNVHIETPSLDVPYFEAATQFRSFQSTPYFESALHMGSPYFSAEAMASPMISYFHDERASHLGAQAHMFMADNNEHAAPAYKDEHHDYVPVYMPIFVPASLFKHGRK